MPAFIAEVGLDSVANNPVIELLGFYLNVTILAAWIHHVGAQRALARDELAVWQQQEQQRLKYEVVRQTVTLNQALEYADEKNRQKTEALGYITTCARLWPLYVGYAKLLDSAVGKAHSMQYIRAIERSAS